MRLKTMLAPLAAVVMLTSCEDIFEDGSLKPDGSKPSLTINNPSNNQGVKAGEGLLVNITAVDKDNVDTLEFTLTGQSSENSVIKFETMPDKRVVEFDTLLNVSGVAPGTYKLRIAATDKRTNITIQEVTVNVQ